MTSKATRKSTFSRALASGPLQLDLLAGLTPDRFGPLPVPASPSAQPARGSGPPIQGICGPTYFGCSVPDGAQDSDLLSLWESRLRERLATVGSTESALIWRRKVSPAGLSISRLAPSTALKSETDSIGPRWTAPRAEAGSALGDPKHLGGRRATGNIEDQMQATGMWAASKASDGKSGADRVRRDTGNPQSALPTQMHMARPWAAPQARCGKGSRTPDGSQEIRAGGQMLNEQMVETGDMAMWSTARASDGEKGGPNMSFGAGGQPLPSQMHQATWGAVSAHPLGGTPEQFLERKRKAAAKGASLGISLTDCGLQMQATAATAPSGPAPSGSCATTVKRGAPNPVFAFWLQGWPAEFRHGVLRAIASLPKRRPKSSRR